MDNDDNMILEIFVTLPSVSADVVIPRHHRRVDARRGREEFACLDHILLPPPVHILRPSSDSLTYFKYIIWQTTGNLPEVHISPHFRGSGR